MNLPIRDYLVLLGQYLRPQRGRVAVMAVLLLANIALQAANPQLLREFIDGAMSGRSTQALTVIAIIFLVLALSTQALAVAATFVSERVGWTATNALRTNLVAHCLRLDMGFHKSRTPGELIQRVDGDVDALSNFFSQFVIHVVGNVILLTVVLVLLFLEDWRVGASLSVFASVALLFLVWLRSFAVPHWARLREEQAKLYGFFGESLTQTEDTRGNGAVNYVMRSFFEHIRRLLPARRRASLAAASMWLTSLLVFTVGNAIAFVIAFYLFRDGTLSIGGVYLIFHYTELIRRPIDQIRAQIEDLQSATASIARVNGLLHRKAAIEDGTGTNLPAGPLRVEIDDVTFSYEAGTPVLQDIRIDLQAGQTLGLLGHTGSGKTTIGRLLLRFYDVDQGEIRLGGHPITKQRLADLRRHVGMVTQDVQLFSASVRDNLTFFDETVPDELLTAVLGRVGLGEWLDSLSDGLGTRLDSGGGGLSAGEAQLLAFARVLLSDPGVVILDEASSRLDPVTEELVSHATADLVDGRTAIVIAHRLSTVKRADQIAIIEDGRIVEHGDRQALADDPASRFCQLLALSGEEATS